LHGLNPTRKRKHCMVTNTTTTCDFWRQNTTRKHDQRCSACRGWFDNVKYIVGI